MMRVIHLETGWNNEGFEEAVQEQIDVMSEEGFSYYDIKISSSNPNTLLIFKKRAEEGMMGERQ